LNATAILGSLGGIVALIGLVAVVVRAIFKQVNSTDANTDAVRDNTAQIKEILNELGDIKTRLAIVEDRQKRGAPSNGNKS
jgi:hypothetical protein